MTAHLEQSARLNARERAGRHVPSVKRRKVEANFNGGDITGNGGIALLSSADRRLGLTRAIAGCLEDIAKLTDEIGYFRHEQKQAPPFPPDIISYAVWLYHRFNLSHRDIEDLLAQRGVTVSHESIRLWCVKFGPEYAKRLWRKH